MINLPLEVDFGECRSGNRGPPPGRGCRILYAVSAGCFTLLLGRYDLGGSYILLFIRLTLKTLNYTARQPTNPTEREMEVAEEG